MSFGGFGGGSPMFGAAGGSRTAASPGGGLPFAGIPSELQVGVDKLLAHEPDHGEPDAIFTHREVDDSCAHLTLRSLILRYKGLAAAAVLVVHRNTLLNRIARIEKLTRLSLKEQRDRTLVLLAVTWQDIASHVQPPSPDQPDPG